MYVQRVSTISPCDITISSILSTFVIPLEAVISIQSAIAASFEYLFDVIIRTGTPFFFANSTVSMISFVCPDDC